MKTILCIDDDAWVLETLVQALSPQGYSVLVTTSTKAGPNTVRYQKVDLVLLDLNMPSKPGLVVFRELEALASEPVPVLFVTGCSRSFQENAAKLRQEYEQEFRLVKTDLLPKPFTLAQLYEKVEAMIGPGSPTEARPELEDDEPKPSAFERLRGWLGSRAKSTATTS